MKRVLIFSLAYYPRVGGAEIAIKEVTERLQDFEWHMVTLRFGNELRHERVGNVMVHRVGFGGSYLSKMLFIPLAALKSRTLHKEVPFNAAWVMMSYMLIPLVLAHLRLPYALTLQEGDTEHHMFGRLRILPFLPLITYGFRRANVVQAISTYLGEWARRRGFKGPLEVVPNGVAIKRFTGERVSHEGVVLITTSRLVHKNGLDDVLRALPKLPRVRFVILGTGPDENKLKTLAKDLGVSERVEFVGHVDHSRMMEYLNRADIFIRPSRSEGMGNSSIEAFAAGLPVIATQVGGLMDFITNDVAWPVAPDRPDEIVEAVKDILARPEKTKEVVARAKRLAAEKYDWGLVATSIREKIFARVL
jgi:glycosyltransferase involved in cell wall biosynthesis